MKRKQQKLTSKNHMIILVSLMIILMAVPLIIAWEFDNVKRVEETFGNAGYKDIEIKNSFGFGKTLWSGTLDYNTIVCGKVCSAEKIITLSVDGSLVDNVKFETINGKDRIEEPINSYQFYIKNGNEWDKYAIGSRLKAGTYTLKLEGYKDLDKEVDWIIKTNGIWIDDWAIWTSSLQEGLLANYNFSETSGDLIDLVTGKYNSTTIKNGVTQNIETTFLTKGYDFNGTNGIEVSVTPALFSGNNGTISLWMNVSWDAVSDADGFNAISFSDDNNYRFIKRIEGDWDVHIGGTTVMNSVNVTKGFWTPNEWVMLSLTWNTILDNYTLWVNNSAIFTTSTPATGSTATFNHILENPTPGFAFNGTATDMSFWNRTLNQSEIEAIYNDGLGLPFGDGIEASLLSPVNDTTVIKGIRNFTCSAETNRVGLVNMSLYHNDSGSFIINQTNPLTGTLNQTSFLSNIQNNIIWSCEACDDDECVFSENNRTLNVTDFEINSTTFNETTYETETELFILNLTTASELSNSKFYYNGTEFTATILNNSFFYELTSPVIDIPVRGSVNHSFFFSFDIGGTNFNTTSANQSVGNTIFDECNATLVTKYLNFSFKDELDSSILDNVTIPLFDVDYWLGGGNLKKNLTFISNTGNLSYVFCLEPPNRSLNVDYRIQYADKAGEYVQRVANNIETVTNATTNRTLFLLKSTDGLFITLQVINPSNQVISGVNITIIKNIAGTDTVVGAGITPDSGSLTFFLDPNFVHRFLFNKTGFNSFDTSFAPTQTAYTITLGGTAAAQAEDFTKGIIASILPTKSIELFNETVYAFNLTLASSFWDVNSFGITLKARNGTILQSTSASTNGGVLNLNQNTSSHRQIIMDYFWEINGNYTNRTTYWNVMNAGNTDWSILTFFTDFNLYLASGIFGLDDFGRNLIIFLIIFISVGVLSFKFGLASPLSISAIVFGVIFFFDVTVNMLPNPVGAIPNFPTFAAGIILISLIFKEVIR